MRKEDPHEKKTEQGTDYVIMHSYIRRISPLKLRLFFPVSLKIYFIWCIFFTKKLHFHENSETEFSSIKGWVGFPVWLVFWGEGWGENIIFIFFPHHFQFGILVKNNWRLIQNGKRTCIPLVQPYPWTELKMWRHLCEHGFCKQHQTLSLHATPPAFTFSQQLMEIMLLQR